MEILRHMWSDQLTYAVGWAMLHSLWQGPAIALAVGAWLRLRNDMPARQRYIVAYTGLIAIFILAVATFAWYFQPIEPAPPAAKEPATWTIRYADTPGDITSIGIWERFSGFFNTYLPLFVRFWAAGLAFFLLRWSGSVAYVQHLKHRSAAPACRLVQEQANAIAAKIGISRVVKVLESTMLYTPAVIGWLKPVILLPVGMVNHLSSEQVEAILAHELAHIRRHDYLLNLLQTFIEALFYFNPAVWHISALASREREHSCDDSALRVCGDSLAYAKALLCIQEMAQPAPRMVMAFGRNKGAFLTRIQRILYPTIKPSSDIMEKITVTGLLLAAVFTLSMRATSVAHNPPANPADAAVVTLDSLPPGKIRIKTDDDGERMEARIENRKIVYLRINDREIPEAELPKYESYVEKKLNENSPPPPPPAPGAPPVPPQPGVVPAPPAPGTPPPPPLPPVPRLREKTVTIEAGDDGITIIKTEADGNKGIAKMRILAPEITFIQGDDTTTVLSPDGLISLGEQIDVMIERQGKKLESIEHDIERQARELEMEARMLKRQDFDMQRQALEMERQARDKGRQAREMQMIEREMQEHDRRMKREFDLQLHPEALAPFAPGNRGNVQAAMENELLRDGLITDRGAYKMELSAGSLKVNGKKMPEGLARKYQKLYEERSGISLESGGKVVIQK